MGDWGIIPKKGRTFWRVGERADVCLDGAQRGYFGLGAPASRWFLYRYKEQTKEDTSMKMKKFINKPEDLTQELLEGMAAADRDKIKLEDG